MYGSRCSKGYAIIFLPFGGVISADHSNRIVLEADSPVVKLSDFNSDTNGHLQWRIEQVMPVIKNTVFPIGTSNQWRKCARAMESARHREDLVEFVHRLTHDPIERRGDDDHFGLTTEILKQHSPACKSCAVKKFKSKLYPVTDTPETKHEKVGSLLVANKFDLRGLPASYGGITAVFTTIDAFSGYVTVFPVKRKSRYSADYIIFCYDRLKNIFRLWGHMK